MTRQTLFLMTAMLVLGVSITSVANAVSSEDATHVVYGDELKTMMEFDTNAVYILQVIQMDSKALNSTTRAKHHIHQIVNPVGVTMNILYVSLRQGIWNLDITNGLIEQQTLGENSTFTKQIKYQQTLPITKR